MKKVVHIKAHVRRLKNGRTIRVREHDVYRYLGTTRKSLGDIMRDKKSRGKELERLMKLREKKLKEFSIQTDKPLEDKVESPKEEQPQVVFQVSSKPYKPTSEDYKKGFHIFDDGSVKYYKKKEVKKKKDNGVSFTPEERKKGFKLEYTSDGTAKVHYTDDALKNMDI